ncbi:MAG: phosphotransacetylase family protein [Chloroflexi bacterium]|nr:phosphotransacetylase family protein [Chloroflexota bacterium]
MGVLYVVSRQAREGTTALCAGLAHLLRHQGQQPALFKPIVVDDPGTAPDGDAQFFAQLDGRAPPQGWPFPVSRQEGREGLSAAMRSQVLAAFGEVAGDVGEVIVEGPAATSPQGEPQAACGDLAELLQAEVVVNVRWTPALTAEEALRLAERFPGRLRGFVINRVPRYRRHGAQTELVTALGQRGVPVLGVLPEERCLLAVTVGHLARHLGGTFLSGEEGAGELVEHVVMGGWVLDWGVEYFQQYQNKAVIVRADRPDIQMAALRTPTRCLVLTGGQRPVQYVEHEAREEGVPMVLVPTDTLTTARALETLFQQATVHHPAKAECAGRLLAQAVDWRALFPLAVGAPEASPSS